MLPVSKMLAFSRFRFGNTDNVYVMGFDIVFVAWLNYGWNGKHNYLVNRLWKLHLAKQTQRRFS